MPQDTSGFTLSLHPSGFLWLLQPSGSTFILFCSGFHHSVLEHHLPNCCCHIWLQLFALPPLSVDPLHEPSSWLSSGSLVSCYSFPLWFLPPAPPRVGWRSGRMTAGTVVITGGILAAVILLCIIVVLCYCRLQYYCCKKHGSDPDAVCPQPQLSCHVDGMVCAPLSPSPDSSFCPSCSPYASTFYIHNGGERLIYLPSQYNNTQAVSTDV